MKNLTNCPVCAGQLDDSHEVCPQCGNAEIEDVLLLDEAESYKQRLREKRLVWQRISDEQARVTLLLQQAEAAYARRKDELLAVSREAEEADRQVKREASLRQDLQREVERLTSELV